MVSGTGVALKLGDQVSIAPADIPLDMLLPEDVFTFNCEFDSAGSPELSSTALNPCHNISAYTNLYLRREPSIRIVTKLLLLVFASSSVLASKFAPV